MNLIEKILANHSTEATVKAGDIIDIEIDARIARDFGGANVVKNLVDNGLDIEDPNKTHFTFDCNPGGSDQKYASNQHYCRQYAHEKGIRVFDINRGIGTHIAIEKGLVLPGGTLVSTDSHANILGAIGAFGQGMGDQDIAAVWANGKAWFKVPQSIEINVTGQRPKDLSAKDICLNLLNIFGANQLLGYAVEFYGEAVEDFTLDERITISSMGTEMGAIILLFTPNQSIINELKQLHGKEMNIVSADKAAVYEKELEVNISSFEPMLAKPGKPHDNIAIRELENTKIDSAFIGSCTNGRMEDLRIAAEILKNKKVSSHVVLKVVPSTDRIWKQALDEGLIQIFKDAGALVSNAGCAGCAAGQVGQNGPEEVTISTGNRNFAGKQGKGEVFLASPEVVAKSAIAGYITNKSNAEQKEFNDISPKFDTKPKVKKSLQTKTEKSTVFQGKVWLIEEDNIDTDMIFHNRYLTITDINEMGQYTFDNLKGYENFAQEASAGDIVMTGKNFGAGSSRQQAVDCFKALQIPCILAESFGAIYERNAINAALPIMTYSPEIIQKADIKNRDKIKVDTVKGKITNLRNHISVNINPLSQVQLNIYRKGGLLA